MRSISIEVSQAEQQKLEAMAASQGKSMRDFLLEKLLLTDISEEENALVALENILDERLAHHATSGLKGRSTVREIFESAIARRK